MHLLVEKSYVQLDNILDPCMRLKNKKMLFTTFPIGLLEQYLKCKSRIHLTFTFAMVTKMAAEIG